MSEIAPIVSFFPYRGLYFLIIAQFFLLIYSFFILWSFSDSKRMYNFRSNVITVGWTQHVILCLRLSLSCCCVRVVHSGTKNSFTMPVMLSFWGKEENKSTVTEIMARRGYKLNTGGGGPTGTNTKKLYCLISLVSWWKKCHIYPCILHYCIQIIVFSHSHWLLFVVCVQFQVQIRSQISTVVKVLGHWHLKKVWPSRLLQRRYLLWFI